MAWPVLSPCLQGEGECYSGGSYCYGFDAAFVYCRIRACYRKFTLFLGAFYLYFINSVFISLATFIGVRVMHFQRKEFVDKEREKLVKKYIILLLWLRCVLLFI